MFLIRTVYRGGLVCSQFSSKVNRVNRTCSSICFRVSKPITFAYIEGERACCVQFIRCLHQPCSKPIESNTSALSGLSHLNGSTGISHSSERIGEQEEARITPTGDAVHHHHHDHAIEVQHIQNKVKLQWKEIAEPSSSESLNYYLKLSKIRLTTLVVLTTLAGYSMGCTTFDTQLALATLAGTGLTSAAAASLNQFLEVPFDSQMMRTRNRPLVLQKLSSGKAITFSLISGVTGLTILTTLVNPLTASLGAFNLVLYSFVYTPMKRANIANTWVGSIVGAIPPVMGFTAATNLIDLPSALLGLILYSWQFPHFNALSWNIRHDYARAGYRMMSVTNEALCTRTAMRHSCLLTLYCGLLVSPLIQLNNYFFAFGSLPLNLYLIYLSWKFKQLPDAQSSRKLFRYSLIHLPALLVLMLITKKTKEKYAARPESLSPMKEIDNKLD
ncbi:cytochrome c oxidase assembly factor 10 [Brevipalpus obovatus]|uniref:cytochrome c oxidase assembly factor 10 n=1 Tax=Brevipalpus obovatus TaxID=246614 RepID=UPI003D9F52EB